MDHSTTQREAAHLCAAVDAQGNLAARRERQVIYLRNTIKMQSYIIQQQRAQAEALEARAVEAEKHFDEMVSTIHRQTAERDDLRGLILALASCPSDADDPGVLISTERVMQRLRDTAQRLRNGGA